MCGPQVQPRSDAACQDIWVCKPASMVATASLATVWRFKQPTQGGLCDAAAAAWDTLAGEAAHSRRQMLMPRRSARSQELGELDGICTYCEMAVPLVARLAERFGLPGNT